ncbi:MAG: hypothetical protein DRJ97_00345 [Thermoprotei archaeon]|nr:MAG: hypothetical protein DRJ97_00345 [Thermoprotei archaeon]
MMTRKGLLEEELKALANPLRFKILKEVAKKPSYPKEVARRLGVSEQLVYYHFDKLEKAGFIQVVGVQEIRGALAKRYAAKYDELVIRFTDSELRDEVKRSLPEVLRRLADEGGIIVVGSPDIHGPLLSRARDQHLAVDLAVFLGSLSRRFKAKLDTEVKDQDLKENLVCVGGPTVNTVTWRINKYLPIYFDLEHENRITSKASGKTYSEEVDGVVEFIENPFKEGKVVVVLAGKRIEGTRASVVAFISRPEEITEGNVYDHSIKAHVVEGLDRDSDGLIDDVEVLE